MANESGEWVIHGMDWDNPLRIHTWHELIDRINEIGFLPLFKNEVEGFSAEESASDLYWWSGDTEQDPWEWRKLIARSREVAYGKFFGRKAGFISKEWYPEFANYRRDGYDFDALWDDELAGIRHKKIMDQIEAKEEWYSYELKQKAGFGKEGEKNFEGIVTDLQMKTYLIISDFRRKRNKKGQEYGWPVSVYTKPETLWGYESISSAYKKSPGESKNRIFSHIKALYPEATDKQLEKVLK